ncbi:hypothetical protein HPO96_20350 [Kribbella sandramycini]|uniref:Uncharacterized protein n=1 Tax=Kribbella sandramycini TaxID=60450 RepID=A0A7Y4L1G7_9ACTN|nr:hypothetical protein [Kribbella sandramycini]MBB6564904.1 hypothetical protein [Kribbella sandramycini]NOL42600.1 hypothetical protein [Kribbella sandramycini]
MYNDPEVSAELHRVADAEPLPPFDTTALLTRAHRGRRRRKLAGAGGLLATVAAVALAATVIPGISSANQNPGPAGTSTPDFTPVPGLERGEAALFQNLSKSEVSRLCALRYPGQTKPLEKPTDARTGARLRFQAKVGEASPHRACSVPGGDRPSAKLIAEAKADPMPASDAGLLRNCAVETWVDVTGWRVVASEISKAQKKVTVVATSPSGKSAVACELELPPRTNPLGDSEGRFLRLASLVKDDAPILVPPKGSKWAELYISSSGGGCKKNTDTDCKKQYSGWGRTVADAAKVRISSSGKTYEKPVTDGWWAITWQVAGSQKLDFKIEALDKSGRKLKTISAQ